MTGSIQNLGSSLAAIDNRLSSSQLESILTAQNLEEALGVRTFGDKFLDIFRLVFRMGTTKEAIEKLFDTIGRASKDDDKRLNFGFARDVAVNPDVRLGAFLELRKSVNPQFLPLFKLDVQRHDNGSEWSYAFKLGNRTIYESEKLSVEADSDALRKFENTALAQNISNVLGRREPPVDVESVIQDTLQASQNESDDPLTTISKIEDAIFAEQPELKVALRMRFNDVGKYFFDFDGTTVHTLSAKDKETHTKLFKSFIENHIKNIFDSIKNKIEDKYIDKNIEYLSSNEDTKKFIRNNLTELIKYKDSISIFGNISQKRIIVELKIDINASTGTQTLTFNDELSGDSGRLSSDDLRKVIADKKFDNFRDIMKTGSLTVKNPIVAGIFEVTNKTANHALNLYSEFRETGKVSPESIPSSEELNDIYKSLKFGETTVGELLEQLKQLNASKGAEIPVTAETPDTPSAPPAERNDVPDPAAPTSIASEAGNS